MDAQEAIGNLEFVKTDRSGVKFIDGFDWLDTCELAIKALECTRWIPVIERLPDSGHYLCTDINYGVYFTDYYDGFKWSKSIYQDHEVTHWMPLPNPPEVE